MFLQQFVSYPEIQNLNFHRMNATPDGSHAVQWDYMCSSDLEGSDSDAELI